MSDNSGDTLIPRMKAVLHSKNLHFPSLPILPVGKFGHMPELSNTKGANEMKNRRKHN